MAPNRDDSVISIDPTLGPPRGSGPLAESPMWHLQRQSSLPRAAPLMLSRGNRKDGRNGSSRVHGPRFPIAPIHDNERLSLLPGAPCFRAPVENFVWVERTLNRRHFEPWKLLPSCRLSYSTMHRYIQVKQNKSAINDRVGH